MRKKSRFVADIEVNHICEIPLDELKAKGISGLIFDLDNTITAWHSMEVAEHTRNWFAQLAEQGFFACILSNSHKERVMPIGNLLGIPAIHMAKKPTKGGYMLACKKMSLSASQVAMVGDQLLTDIFGGNRVGLTTILTSMMDENEFWMTRVFSRTLERHIKKRCQRKV